MASSRSVVFELDYEQNKKLPIGTVVRSQDFSAGGHTWRIHCYPRGQRTELKGEYILIWLALAPTSENVRALFQVCLLNRDGTSSLTEAQKFVFVFKPETPGGQGWGTFVKGSHLELTYCTNGVAKFLCSVTVLNGPHPDGIRSHFGNLLDCAIGSDVSVVVGGETFPAHRAVLAARSPVFKAELFGLMADATMPSITVQDVEPAVFKLMLRFMYTDSLPAYDELGDSPIEMLLHLLAVADRYALDLLKLLCQHKLWENISAETVASTLACAETYNCPKLKTACMDFFVVQQNFNKAVFTNGFTMLLKKFPVLAAELARRVEKENA